MYLLRKWYFDLLTPGGTYLFLYFAFIRLAGATTRSLVLHIAPEGSAGSDTFHFPVDFFSETCDRGLNVGLKDGTIRVDRNGCRIGARNSRASVDLHLAPIVPGGTRPVLIEPRGRGHILWEPIGIRYRVDGQVVLDGRHIDVNGCAGYADFLESTILPPWVPVRRLLWGRAHLPGANLTFMRASGAAGSPAWSRLIVHRGGKIEESDNVEITEQSGPHPGPATAGCDSYTLEAQLPDERLSLTVSRQKRVQCASFIDQQEIRWPIARSLAKRFTRDPHGSKYLCHIDITGWNKSEPPHVMIDEEAFL